MILYSPILQLEQGMSSFGQWKYTADRDAYGRTERGGADTCKIVPTVQILEWREPTLSNRVPRKLGIDPQKHHRSLLLMERFAPYKIRATSPQLIQFGRRPNVYYRGHRDNGCGAA